MNSAGIKNIMSSSFERFNIELEPPKEDRLQEMTENITGEKFGVQLPYLQVYLDLLYRKDYERTYASKEPDELYPPLTFTKQEIDELGKIEDVLEQFIQEQEKSLQVELSTAFNAIPDNAVHKVLDAICDGRRNQTSGSVYERRRFDAARAKICRRLTFDFI